MILNVCVRANTKYRFAYGGTAVNIIIWM